MTKNVPELKLVRTEDENHEIVGLPFAVHLFTGWHKTRDERLNWFDQAERMVAAWNSHQELVDALDDLLMYPDDPYVIERAKNIAAGEA